MTQLGKLIALAAPFSLLCANVCAQTPQEQIGQFETLDDAMAQPGLSRTQRFETGDLWCHRAAYPDELACSARLASLAEAELESIWAQSMQIADGVDNYQRDQCASADSANGCNIPALMDMLALAQETWQEYATVQCEAEARKAQAGWGGTADRNFCRARIAAIRAEEIDDMMGFYRAQFGTVISLGEEDR